MHDLTKQVKSKNDLFFGFGHKARQGKDDVAQYIKNNMSNVYIIHFADGVYSELMEKNYFFPLIKQKKFINSNKYYYLLRDKKILKYFFNYQKFSQDELPELHKIFVKRKINCYKNMTTKDAEILQIWGTEYRRKSYEDYWIRIALLQIIQIQKLNKNPKIFIFPDLRFFNEKDLIKSLNGITVNFIRLNEDGTRFIDKSRDPKHQSECELDKYKFDHTFKAKSGQINKIYPKVEKIIYENLNKKYND